MSYNAYLFAIDETITVDEDYFELNVVPSLTEIIEEIGKKKGIRATK